MFVSFFLLGENHNRYERGLTSVPLSVDLWNHFLNFLQSADCANDPATASFSSPEFIRRYIFI